MCKHGVTEMTQNSVIRKLIPTRFPLEKVKSIMRVIWYLSFVNTKSDLIWVSEQHLTPVTLHPISMSSSQLFHIVRYIKVKEIPTIGLTWIEALLGRPNLDCLIWYSLFCCPKQLSSIPCLWHQESKKFRVLQRTISIRHWSSIAVVHQEDYTKVKPSSWCLDHLLGGITPRRNNLAIPTHSVIVVCEFRDSIVPIISQDMDSVKSMAFSNHHFPKPTWTTVFYEKDSVKKSFCDIAISAFISFIWPVIDATNIY